MLPTLLLAAVLSAAPGVALEHPSPPRAGEPDRPSLAPFLEHPSPPRSGGEGQGRGGPRLTLAQSDDDAYDDDVRPEDEDERRRPHVLLSAWGGEALAHGGSGRSSSFYGGEAAWVFSSLDLGISGAWYRSLRDATREWTPVVMTRVTQRFLTRRGFEAAFSLGFGAGRPSGWIGWYQVALGMRVPLGPLFLGGELAFEQYDIIRLGAGLGVGF